MCGKNRLWIPGGITGSDGTHRMAANHGVVDAHRDPCRFRLPSPFTARSPCDRDRVWRYHRDKFCAAERFVWQWPDDARSFASYLQVWPSCASLVSQVKKLDLSMIRSTPPAWIVTTPY